MLGMITKVLGGGADFIEAELRLAIARLARLGVALAALVVVAVVGGAAIIGLAIAGVIALAPHWGWPGAILAVGGGALVAAMLTGWIAVGSIRRAMRPVDRKPISPAADPNLIPDNDGSLEEAREQARSSRKELHQALHGRSSRRQRERSGIHGLADDAMRFAMRHPEAAIAAAFAVASLLGPSRIIRTVGRAASLATLASSVMRVVTRDTPDRDPSWKEGARGNGSAAWK